MDPIVAIVVVGIPLAAGEATGAVGQTGRHLEEGLTASNVDAQATGHVIALPVTVAEIGSLLAPGSVEVSVGTDLEHRIATMIDMLMTATMVAVMGTEIALMVEMIGMVVAVTATSVVIGMQPVVTGLQVIGTGHPPTILQVATANNEVMTGMEDHLQGGVRDMAVVGRPDATRAVVVATGRGLLLHTIGQAEEVLVTGRGPVHMIGPAGVCVRQLTMMIVIDGWKLQFGFL